MSVQQQTIEASKVRPGDEVFDGGHYTGGRWVRVVDVGVGYKEQVLVDVGYCRFVFHARQGVAVRRG